MKDLRHPNIIRIYGVIDDPNSENIYLIMELMTGGTLADAKLTHRIPEPLAKSYFVGLVSAVKYLHSLKIIHRDIKPENILVSPAAKVAKFCDFSSAERLEPSGNYLISSAGTPAFIPPELCKEYDTPPLGYPIDIWSLGVTLYCIIYGIYPFTGRTLTEMYDNIINKPLCFRPDLVPISQELKDLLNQMLNKNPLQRITAEQIQQHPWLRSRQC
jgi:serine/threonine protein kinase